MDGQQIGEAVAVQRQSRHLRTGDQFAEVSDCSIHLYFDDRSAALDVDAFGMVFQGPNRVQRSAASVLTITFVFLCILNPAASMVRS